VAIKNLPSYQATLEVAFLFPEKTFTGTPRFGIAALKRTLLIASLSTYIGAYKKHVDQIAREG
jgi:hypothetical protein